MLELVEFQNWYETDLGPVGGDNTTPKYTSWLLGENLCVALPDRRHHLDIVLRCSRIECGLDYQVEGALRRYAFPPELLVDGRFETYPEYLETPVQLQVFRELLDFAWKNYKRRLPVITHSDEEVWHRRRYTATQRCYASQLTISEQHVHDFVKMKSNGVLRPVQKKPRLRLVKTAAESV